jgi:CHAT domain-containing protein/tetratricopeptide (TPR) repeat protein
MKRCFVLCLAGWLAAAAGAHPPEPIPPPLTKEQQDKLEERDRLEKEVQKLWPEGKRVEAIAATQRMLAIEREVRGAFHPNVAGLLDLLAEMQAAVGDFPSARNARRELIAIQTKRLGAQHWQVTDARLALDDVERLARMEPSVRRQLQDAVTLGEQVGQLYLQGKTEEGIAVAQKVLEIRKRGWGEWHPDYAVSLNDLAALYQDQGEYAKAGLLHRQALAIRKQVLGERHPAYAQSLNNLALLYRSQEAYDLAEPLARQAVDIYKEVRGERHPSYANSLNNLAVLYHFQGKYAQAEPLYRQALAIYKQVLGQRHPAYASSLNNLALLYESQGRSDRAEPLLHEVLALTKQVLGECHPEYARSLYNLAVLYHSQGKYTRAEPLYRQALAALRQRAEGPPWEFEQLTAADLRPLPATVICLAHYCVLFDQRLGPQPTVAQLRAADHAFALALAVRERLRHEVLEEEASKLQHGAKASDLVPRRIGLCQRLFDREGRVDDLEIALATAEQGTARLFLEHLGKARALSVGRVSATLREQEVTFRQQLRALDTQMTQEHARPSSQRDPTRLAKLLDQQKQVEAQRNELIQRMEKEYPQYAALKYPKPCSLAEARACLAPSEVALLFVLGNERSFVVLVEARPAGADKANGLAIYPLPGFEEIADGISCLTDPDTLILPVKARAVAEQTYDLLLGPLKERIRGKDLVVVPGGPLGYLPFEALVEDGHYLIEKHRIRYAPSLTALHLVRQWEPTRPRPTQPLWALGDPVYDAADVRLGSPAGVAAATRDAQQEVGYREGRPGIAFRRLIHSGREVQAIAQLLRAPADSVLSGPQALEAMVKKASASGALAKARYIHFATHGILGLDTGQSPALVLSLIGNDGARDADGGINDGFLRLDEVTRLKLNADLVVLSACETGRGRLYAGEGVSGLARAFLYAGSRGVVCSLWSVDDRETAALMTRLYGGLKEGRPTADALRSAKLATIQEGKAPVYWAPFILIGE